MACKTILGSTILGETPLEICFHNNSEFSVEPHTLIYLILNQGSWRGTVMLLLVFLEALPGGNGSMWWLLILLFTTLGVMDEEALSQHMLTPLFFPSHVRRLRDTLASLCLETVPLYELPLCLNVSSNRHGSVSRGFHISHPLRCFLGFGRGADRLQSMICVENGYGEEEEEEGSRWQR